MTYSAESAGSVSGCTGLGCARTHSARAIRLPARSSAAIGPVCPCMTIFARCPPCGCTLMAYRGLGCSAAASPAKTSASRVAGRASRVSARGCGPTWRASCVSADRVGWWLRTFLACEAGVRTGCCLTWRLRATPAGRSWWVLSMPALRTGAAACGWWRKPFLPTDVALDRKHVSVTKKKRRRACQLNDAVGGLLHPGYAEWMMGFPQGWTGSVQLSSDVRASECLATP